MGQVLHIDFGRIHEIARLGIRRTVVFLGLGLNAGHDPDFNDYQLARHSALRLIPEDVPQKKVEEFKVEFCRWVVANGMRELVETFCVFLDSLYEACKLLEAASKPIPENVSEKALVAFERRGLPDKLSRLSSEFGISSDKQECLQTIYQVRNCLAHRRGIVGEVDCNSDSALTVRWFWYEIWAEQTSGEVLGLDLPITEPVYLDNAQISLALKEKSKVIPCGVAVDFTAQELTEICDFIGTVADQLRQRAVDYAIKSGATIAEKPQ